MVVCIGSSIVGIIPSSGRKVSKIKDSSAVSPSANALTHPKDNIITAAKHIAIIFLNFFIIIVLSLLKFVVFSIYFQNS